MPRKLYPSYASAANEKMNQIEEEENEFKNNTYR
jgi:hypothetical protein